MKPYVEAWEVSHHADVTCTDCHFPPGFKQKIKGKFTALSMLVNYFTGVYKKSKPWAEISDESCLRSGCHVERLLDDQVIFKKGILFNHKPHLTELRRDKKLRCTSCHSQIVQGEHITVTESTCFLCHFKNQPLEAPINDCTWCHAAPTKETDPQSYDHSFVLENGISCEKCHGEMQIGDGAVPMERCSSCHAEIGHLEMYEDAAFIHKHHVTDHKVECQNCHLVIQHKSQKELSRGVEDCNSCHENSHSSQTLLFSGSGGLNVPNHPNPMFDSGLNCQGCHLFHQIDNNYESLGQTSIAKAESCEICHGEGYSRILSQWEAVMAEKVRLIGESVVKIRDSLQSVTIQFPVSEQVSDLMAGAEYNLNLVQNGNFIHNVAYSDELISAAFLNLHEVNELTNAEIELPEIDISSRLVPSECKNCHYGLEDAQVKAFGIQFRHDIHIEKNQIKCSKCHSNVSQHGETIISKDQCLNCHHTQEKRGCDYCHEIQEQIYSATIPQIEFDIEDFMYSAGVECNECHMPDGDFERPDESICSNCHDEEYEDIMLDRQANIKASILDLDKKLNILNNTNLSEAEQLTVQLVTTGLEIINQDKSFGVHNLELIGTMIHEYSRLLNGILSQYNYE